MKSYHITLEGQTYEVEILSDPRLEQVQVRVNGETLTVTVSEQEQALPATPAPAATVAQPAATPAKPAAPAAPAPRPPARGNQLAAPLPGTIVQIAVQAGQTVSAGAELLVIEAMKMNNRIRSPRDGTIGQVLVAVGEQVGHGAPLIAWAD